MSDPLFSVAGQRVLAVGASRGIGRAIAGGFALRGARVTIVGRVAETLDATAAELSRSAEHPVKTLVCDVADPEAIDRKIGALQEQEGPFDTLLMVAGINRRKPATELTRDEFDAVIDINLKGAWHVARVVGRPMLERGSGNQIHVTSLNVDRPLANVAPYAMSKAGLQQMVRALALEWGRQGVRVNGLAPGFILTDLTKKLWSDPGMATWNRDNTPLGRLGTPDDLIGAALFLASPAAAFVTGVSLVVDGGFSSGWSWPIPPNNQ